MEIDYKKLDRDRKKIVKMKESDRYQNVLYFLYSKGFFKLVNKPRIIRNKKIDILDILWASKIEPRILEVFPAAFIHFKSKFSNIDALPKGLEKIINQIKTNSDLGHDYKGISYIDMKRWSNINLSDKRSKPVNDQKLLRSFKLSKEVLEKLELLANENKTTRTEVIESLIMSYNKSS
ncbi:hypothetical protein A9Q84_13715 [Halobacteriovorax marinus]|uniref:Uncharacterized protein n=1 Tax=Halobacteriovorax marinus TaxID=97084 RepID=A0A1Y5F8V1_9BACT|nr:hypothetical protein A9Q84_13715 [Halobacteriovorax marinus]